jgi:hypothetical protein
MPAGIAGGPLIVSARYGSIAQTMPVPLAKSCAACARGTPTSSPITIMGTNPNVMLEVGMAAALGKEVILIGEDASLPFDIRHWRKITYDPHELHRLTEALVSALGSVSARYPHEGAEPRF